MATVFPTTDTHHLRYHQVYYFARALFMSVALAAAREESHS